MTAASTCTHHPNRRTRHQRQNNNGAERQTVHRYVALAASGTVTPMSSSARAWSRARTAERHVSIPGIGMPNCISGGTWGTPVSRYLRELAPRLTTGAAGPAHLVPPKIHPGTQQRPRTHGLWPCQRRPAEANLVGADVFHEQTAPAKSTCKGS